VTALLVYTVPVVLGAMYLGPMLAMVPLVTLANVWCVLHYLLGARTLRQDLLSRPDA
jgi:uncharacterized membrane protein